MKHAVFVAAGLSLCLSAWAGLELVAPPARLEPPPDATRIPAVLKLRNQSVESLTLREIRSCCGCLTAASPSVGIAPGAEFELPFSYDAKGRKGLQKGSLTLVPATGEPLVVPIEVFLRRSFDAEPRLLRWKKDAAESFLEVQIEVDPSLAPAAPRISNSSTKFPAELRAGPRPGVWILRVTQATQAARDSLTLELPLPEDKNKSIEIFCTRE